MNPHKFKLMEHVYHRTEHGMVGRVLAGYSDMEVYVEWDGGVKQWVPRESVTTTCWW